MAQHISDLLAPRRGNGQSIFQIARDPRIRLPKLPGEGIVPIRDRLTPRSCLCTADRVALGCPWHLGRHSEPVGIDETIPRLHGVSSGAWAAFLVIWRGIKWAAQKGAKEGKLVKYTPGRFRLARAVGGRNARTRQRDPLTKRFASVRSWEKGECDEGTITAYLHELASCVLPENGLPVIGWIRRSRTEAEIVMNRELLEPSKPAYRVRRAWELLQTDPAADLTGPAVTASNSGGESPPVDNPSSIGGLPYRLRPCNPTSQHDLGTYVTDGRRSVTVNAAVAEPWWPSVVAEAGHEGAARALIRNLTRMLIRDSVDIGDLLNAYAVATEAYLRNGKVPKSWSKWLYTAAKNRYRTKEQVRALEPVAAIIGGAELAETARQRIAIGHDAPDASPELAAAGGAPPDQPPGSGGGGYDPDGDDGMQDDPDAIRRIVEETRARMEAAHAERRAADDAEKAARRAEREQRLGGRQNPWGNGA